MSRPLIEIDTPNKDIVISFVYAWARQKEMSILEVNELVKAVEAEFGVSAAAVAAPAAAPAEEAHEEEQSPEETQDDGKDGSEKAAPQVIRVTVVKDREDAP